MVLVTRLGHLPADDHAAVVWEQRVLSLHQADDDLRQGLDVAAAHGMERVPQRVRPLSLASGRSERFHAIAAVPVNTWSFSAVSPYSPYGATRSTRRSDRRGAVLAVVAASARRDAPVHAMAPGTGGRRSQGLESCTNSGWL